MQKQYSNEQLHRIAIENYGLLSEYCAELDREGYFSDAGNILHLSMGEVLDFYVQSLMVQFLVFGKRLTEEEVLFTASLTSQDILGLRAAWIAGDLSEAVGRSAKFLEAPPIILQLLCLRDQKKHIGVTGLFFDALLNVMICLSYLNQVRDTNISKFIGLYFDKVAVFLENREDESRTVDGKYIFKKLCSGNLTEGGQMLRDAGSDFASYKKKYFYYRQSTGAAATEVRREQRRYEEEVPGYLPNVLADAAVDAVESIKEKKAVEEIDRLTAELDRMVGLGAVKEEIRSLINLIKVKKLREKYKLPQMNMSYHMVFTGSPGTGKTTVARLVAKIYRELGILSKGTLTETDRSGLVAGYVGQTALKVKETVERALGGVLFIDEAYALAPENASNDFGGEAIDTLVKLMEDHRDDLVIIVAGYTEEMKRFLKANTGLQSRFNKFITFEDYEKDELLAILDAMAADAGFCLTEEAKAKVEKMLEDLDETAWKEFGNARGVRNLFERLVSNQANRIIAYNAQSIKDITVITEEDVTV